MRLFCTAEGKPMKLSKVIAIPAIALTAGLSLAACGSAKAPAAAPAITHTVTAPAAAPKPTTPAPTTAAPAPAKTVYVQTPAAPAPEPAYFTDSTAVVQQFYQDINDEDFSGAWALGGDNIGGSDYAGWMAGYDTTVSVSLGTFSAFGSDQVQAGLSALQSDGTTNTYEGTYTVSDGVIVAATIVQTG